MNARAETAAAVPQQDLKEIERLAVELANLAGTQIVLALGGILEVRYKGSQDPQALYRDPVSEVDSRVEQMIRVRLSETFPEHDIIGEEFDERPGRDHDFIWAIDPIDGTTNFVNGFPLFAASVGVLYQGRPLAGAVWCAASHALRAGVYHGCSGGPFKFEGDPVIPRRNPAVRRHLAGVPIARSGQHKWETRKTGSAAIECAFVAAGLLEAARFDAPNLWDVAGGVALVEAADGCVITHDEQGWRPFERFEGKAIGGGTPDLRNWKQPLILGQLGAKDLVAGLGESM